MNTILFIDIETVSLTRDFEALPERLKAHWEKKASFFKREEPYEELYFERAAIYAEFGRVLCIGVGGFYENGTRLKVSSLYAEDEKELLISFKELVEKHPAGKNLILCAHNGKEFDFPYLCRRMLINGIPLPGVLNISGKKPWEIQHLDTLEMWKFGDFKHYTSLDLLASVFDIPGSKGTMDGSEVNSEYYLHAHVDKIREYCREDVVVLAQLYRKLSGKSLIAEENIMRA
ncbi:MAG: 3'-5' exonuclease [Leadbetterella sp.]|nr:3'-5' exonuclease [Leadbetterella sp.]